MIERVAQMTYAAAVYAMPNILWGQILAASPVLQVDADGVQRWIRGDTKAANFVATIAKFMRGGTVVNQTQNNVSPLAEIEAPEMSDDDLRNRMRELLSEEGDEGAEGT